MALTYLSQVDSSGGSPPENSRGGTFRRIANFIGVFVAGIAAVMAPSSQGHQCGGCPMCMPPPVTRSDKEQTKKEDEDKKQ